MGKPTNVQRPAICPHKDCALIHRLGTDGDQAWSCFGKNDDYRSCQFFDDELRTHEGSTLARQLVEAHGREPRA